MSNCIRANGATQLSLFQRGADFVCSGIAVECQGAGAVLNNVPVWKDKDNGISELPQGRSNHFSVSLVESKRAPFLSKAVIGSTRLAKFLRKQRQ